MGVGGKRASKKKAESGFELADLFKNKLYNFDD
jgi:hypothetical protein